MPTSPPRPARASADNQQPPLPRPGAPLRTERLLLTTVAASDLEFLTRLHSDPAAFAHDTTPPLTSPAQMAHVMEQWEERRLAGGCGYALVSLPGADAPVPIGVAGLKTLPLNGEDVLNLYVRISPAHWRRGYAREALRALLAQVDEAFPGKRAVIVTDAGNAPMRALSASLGFHETDEQEPGFGAPHVIAQRFCGAGRYAPSPSGDLHLGNLRTAVLAWLFARREGRRFVMRVEDLDRVKPGAAERQLEDLSALGVDWDGPVLYQSSRADAYREVLADLTGRGLCYECYCTRAEILAAPSAPHAPPGAYPGTCRELGAAQREAGRARMAELRRTPALRLWADDPAHTVYDRFAGRYTGQVDDTVLTRGDGVVAYNLAVVVDDAFQGVGQVTRGDDLLSSAPRQAWIGSLLGIAAPEYVHVPLALNGEGKRLAKRDGAVTLRERLARGESRADVIGLIATSLGYPGVRSLPELLGVFDPAAMPREPWIVSGE
ncbi:tRNA glutamyl-Q(34) synthetase GluQRS [Dermabacteraceae bacterium TAE3-ERU5]|nr:tRNA glutamyl-Q(34) synthetase GluQRS [Dermabacteraceae bacterium TAE3-ERU5]